MFRLLHHFSVISSVGIFVVVLALSLFYRHLAFADLIAHEERSNVSLTQALANSLGQRLYLFIESSEGRLSESPGPLDAADSMRQSVVGLMKGLNIVKVKVFDHQGMTLFSTQISQIGELRAGDKGFIAAIGGDVVSALVFKHQVDTFHGVKADRNLVSSYVPVVAEDGSGSIGVIEVYSDVTELVDALDYTLAKIVGGVTGCLLSLYLFLFLVVRRADRILQQSSDEIRYLAYHDALTGLPNRRLFTERLESMLNEKPAVLAVFFVDLDSFKLVNDRFGHDAGDRLLKVQSERLKSCFDSAALIARFGGDEFAIIAPACERNATTTAAMVGKLSDELGQPVELNGALREVSCSVGVSYYPYSGTSVDDLLRNADHAMYRMKKSSSKYCQSGNSATETV
ncbi:GGDEF domain-containing protein [Marinobacterium jannaschii]|uniref:GGDEF domain-containing protein n=1 Tax=Marinobacterium jannaschii TaxID=64970 RepID=UPI0006864F61|nr:GGDEF domain-containing protein [Marinobacterium jannaschii]